MKAILVIDEMPNACENCLLDIDGLCAGTREPIHSIGCPLKPLPNRQKVKAGAGGYTRGFTAGFNKFRYLIAGEAE